MLKFLPLGVPSFRTLRGNEAISSYTRSRCSLQSTVCRVVPPRNDVGFSLPSLTQKNTRGKPEKASKKKLQ
jgi:hypothetical protein